MAKPNRAEVEAVLARADDDLRGVAEAIRTAPVDCNPQLLGHAAVVLSERGRWHFARAAKDLPLEARRVVMRELETRSEPWTILMREIVGDGADATRWAMALEATLDVLSSYDNRSKVLRAKLLALAKNPLVLSGIQACVVASQDVDVRLFTVLALDGSDASIDAMLPLLTRATQAKDNTLDAFTRLEKACGDVPVMKQLFAQVKAVHSERSASSPALQVFEALSLPTQPTLWFHVSLSSRLLTPGNVGRYQASLRVDSRVATWLRVDCSELLPDFTLKRTSFASDGESMDMLGLGTCGVLELPKWLARTQKKLKAPWNHEGLSLRTGLRGKAKDTLRAWIVSGLT